MPFPSLFPFHLSLSVLLRMTLQYAHDEHWHTFGRFGKCYAICQMFTLIQQISNGAVDVSPCLEAPPALTLRCN